MTLVFSGDPEGGFAHKLEISRAGHVASQFATTTNEFYSGNENFVWYWIALERRRKGVKTPLIAALRATGSYLAPGFVVVDLFY